MIGLISAYDTFLIVKLQALLRETEQNPIGRMLITEDGDVSYFVAVKMAGTIVALGLLAAVHRHMPKISLQVAVPMLLFQVALFIYLVGYDPVANTIVDVREWMINP